MVTRRANRFRKVSPNQAFGVEQLEPRQMLAGTPFTGTTADDGDMFTISVSGPGQVDTNLTTTSGSGIFRLALTGTTADSILRITVRRSATGNGRIGITQLDDALLKQIDATAVDYVGFLNLSSLRRAVNFGSFSGFLELSGAAGTAISARFGHINNATIMVTGATVNITAESIEGSSITASVLGLFNITGNRATNAPGDFSGNLTFASVSASSKITVAGTVRGGTWTIPGNVNAITVGSITADADNNPFTLSVAGSVRSLTSTVGALSGSFTAVSFGTIKSKAGLSGTVTATGVDATGKGIGSLAATTATNLALVASGTNAAIGSIKFVSWNGGSITASSVGSLAIKGAVGVAGDLDIDMTLSHTGPSLTSLAVVGSVRGGTWTTAGSIGSLTAGSFARDTNNEPLWLMAVGAVGSVTTKIGSLDAHISASSFGAIKSKTGLSGSLVASSVDARGNGILSIFATTASDVVITASGTAAAIGSVSFTDWDEGTLTASSLGTMTTRGGVGNPGDMQADITLTGAVGRDSLATLSVKGALRSSNLRIAGNAGALSMARVFDSILQVGTNTNVGALPNSGSVLAADGGTIRSIRVTAPFDVAAPGVTNCIIVARNITSLSVTGYTQPNNGGTAFGIAARTVGSFSAKRTDGTPVTLRNIATQQQVDDAGLQFNDFDFRII